MRSSASAERRPKNIDVIILTKNSDYILEECLNSIYDNIPVNKLIAIDGSSTDNTLTILNKFNDRYGNVRIVFDNGTRATAREAGINCVETDWFMFVDSDVILCKDWLKKASKHMEEDVGAIWGINIDVIENFNSRTFYRLFAHVSKEAFNIRGGMHDTLIRREVVKDIKIPSYLHTYEDAHIVTWIKQKGYKVVVGDKIYCLHIRPPEDWSMRESLSLATWEIRCGLVHFKAFKYILYYPFFILYWLLQKYAHANMQKTYGRTRFM